MNVKSYRWPKGGNYITFKPVWRIDIGKLESGFELNHSRNWGSTSAPGRLKLKKNPKAFHGSNTLWKKITATVTLRTPSRKHGPHLTNSQLITILYVHKWAFNMRRDHMPLHYIFIDTVLGNHTFFALFRKEAVAPRIYDIPSIHWVIVYEALKRETM